ncbi:MAG: ribose 5-phosphate isomerase B [Bdellovibrionales bacterium]
MASDHAGFELKRVLIESPFPVQWSDLGPDSAESVDYPDFADLVCDQVRKNVVQVGVLICGSGIGMSIRANRYPGIRAALCLTPEMAALSRQHNDANVLVLGARLTPSEQAIAILQTFITTEFEGGRHQKRVTKIDKEIKPLISEE